jgi:hypothetical protein
MSKRVITLTLIISLTIAVCGNYDFECFWGDHRICPGSKCKNGTKYFQCKDGKFCIFAMLLCDGHIQCDDGSDEEFCSVCPRENSSLQKGDTFPCKHRYTGFPICANPCDGYDDLCENHSDEDCEGISVLWVLFWVTSLTIIASGTTIILEKKCTPVLVNDMTTTEEMCYSTDILSLKNYTIMRKEEAFVNSMRSILLYYKFNIDIEKAKHITEQYYAMELTCNQFQTECVDEYYFMFFGTNKSTAYIYDILSNSWSIKMNSFLASKCPKWLLVKCTHKYFKMSNIYVIFIFKIVLHYADIVKDIVLLVQIWKHMMGNSARTFLDGISEFPVVVFLVIFTSIVITELCSILTLIMSSTFEGYGKCKKWCSILLFPLIPASVHYQEFKLELEHVHMLSKNNIHLHFKIDRNERKNMLLLRSNLTSIENVAEHFPLLLVLILIITLRKTATPIVAQMDKLFLSNNEIFIFLSTCWSFFSLLKGQLFYIKATKNNVVTILGHIILLLYFAIGTSGRLLFIALFFTPLLGLFDTNYHGVLGNRTVETFMSISNGEITKLHQLFDYMDTNKPIFFDEAWERFKVKEKGLFHFQSTLLLCICVTITFHLVVGFMIQLKANRHTKERTTNKIFQTLYTLLSPPLYLDWEEIYRDGKGSITIKDSWRKSQKFLVCHILMNFIEHIVLCIPLTLFKSAIQERNMQLSKLFPPLNDELYSTFIVNLLLGVSITVLCVLPPLQYGLAHLYFVKGHPWSRLLNSKLMTK